MTEINKPIGSSSLTHSCSPFLGFYTNMIFYVWSNQNLLFHDTLPYHFHQLHQMEDWELSDKKEYINTKQ